MNRPLTDRLIRFEMAMILGTRDLRSFYFRCSMPDDGRHLNKLVVAYKGKIGDVRFSEEDRSLSIDDFADLFLRPLQGHIAPDPYVWIDPWAVVHLLDTDVARGASLNG